MVRFHFTNTGAAPGSGEKLHQEPTGPQESPPLSPTTSEPASADSSSPATDEANAPDVDRPSNQGKP